MAWHSGVNTKVRVPTVIGALALLVGFGGFGTWAAVAPLEGAVIAPGTVTVSGHNKVVQHLEGGIVKDALVKDGDRVTAGDPLLVLDATAAESARNRLSVQYDTSSVIAARLLAERDGLAEFVFSPDTLAPVSREAAAVTIRDQQSEFRTRLDRHKAELDILGQKIAASGEEISGLEAYKEGVALQLELVIEEKIDAEGLFAKGLMSKGRVLQLKRSAAELKGNLGQLTARIAMARQSIAENRQEIQRLKVTRLEEASAKLAEVRLQQADVLERLRAAQYTLDRIVVRAPASGTVINAAKYNAGAVVTPGQSLMEIVPDDTELIVEAHVRPIDIDEVRLGQAARLTFAALDHSTVPQVPGEVFLVSADRLENQRTGEAYYIAKLKISNEPIGGFDPTQIGAGQPVEVFITTGERTFLTYLTDPITKSFKRGMREH